MLGTVPVDALGTVPVDAQEVVARDVDSFTFDAPLHSSWLFCFADDAESLLAGY